VIRSYVPEAGDLIWLEFTPPAGREAAGRRGAVVLSPSAYNRRSRLAIICPVTHQAKGYPFEVSLPKTSAITGVVLADHLRSLDWQVRGAAKAGRVARQAMTLILERIALLLELAKDAHCFPTCLY
jgi:mRNA interferase MazF